MEPGHWCLMLCSALATGVSSSLVTVILTPSGELEVVEGWREEESWVARANLTDSQQQTGWLQLSVDSNPARSNLEQAEGAGVAEGYLTRDLIHGYYLEFIHRDLCGVSADFCRWIQERLAWQEEASRSRGSTDPYWEQVSLFYHQMEGLRQGWQARTQEDGFQPSQDFDLKWFGHMINFLPDISDYIHHYKEELAARQGVGLRLGEGLGSSLPLRAALPSCSVLVRRLPSGQAVVGHATWHDYRAMGYRLTKRYSLPYRLAGGGLVPGHRLAMTSYAGTLYSLDDFYVLSSGLVTTETTLFVYNKELFKKIPPGEGVSSL